MVSLVVRLAVAVALVAGGGIAATPSDIATSAAKTAVIPALSAVTVRADSVRVDVPGSPAVEQQLNYAIAYWHRYNVAGFGDFNAWGGDCQNFVSQTLMARGWAPNEEWFNDAQVEWGSAFVHVPSFDEYLRDHPEFGAVPVALDEREQIKLGDLVVYDWDRDGSLDHIEVVARIEHRGDRITISTLGHSDIDSWYLDLDRAITVQHPGAAAYFWSIP